MRVLAYARVSLRVTKVCWRSSRSSEEPVPEGRHRLRFEFEPTGSPDFAVGKGAPGRFQLYVDGELDTIQRAVQELLELPDAQAGRDFIHRLPRCVQYVLVLLYFELLDSRLRQHPTLH